MELTSKSNFIYIELTLEEKFNIGVFYRRRGTPFIIYCNSNNYKYEINLDGWQYLNYDGIYIYLTCFHCPALLPASRKVLLSENNGNIQI